MYSILSFSFTKFNMFFCLRIDPGRCFALGRSTQDQIIQNFLIDWSLGKSLERNLVITSLFTDIHWRRCSKYCFHLQESHLPSSDLCIMDSFGVFFGVTVGSGFSWEMSQKLCFFCRLPWIWEETNRRNVSKGISARLCFLSLQEAFLGLSGLRWATPAPYSSTRLKCIFLNWNMYLSAPAPYSSTWLKCICLRWIWLRWIYPK